MFLAAERGGQQAASAAAPGGIAIGRPSMVLIAGMTQDGTPWNFVNAPMSAPLKEVPQ
jgi:hypothetical protein